MTTTNDPDEIRRDIERTRARLSNDVNALADEAKPGNVAKRQVEKVKGGARDLKDRIMGGSDGDDPYAHLSSAGSSVAQFGSDAAQAVQDAPGQLKNRTRGNPLAAGMIAFGAGALIAGLIPASRQEQHAAANLAEKAQPVVEQAKEVAQDLVGNLKEPAQEAVQNVRDSATDSVQNVRDTGQSHAEDLGDHARDAKDNVRQS